MSPFLAQLQVINVTGKSADSEATEESLRTQAANLKAKALTQAAAGLKEADDSLSEAGQKTYEGQSTPSKHHSKSSSDEDMVYAAIPIVAIVFTFIYLIVRALMAPFSSKNKRGGRSPVVMEGLSAEEAAVLEKLQRTLAQMESRVESLETILIDPTRTKEKYGTKL